MVTAAELAGGGLVGTWLRSHPWANTPLGPMDTWPMSLKTTLSILLNACCPAALIWGSDRLFFCNDAYLALFDDTFLPLGQSIRGEGVDAAAVIPFDGEVVFATGNPQHWEPEPMTAGNRPDPDHAKWHSCSGSASAVWDAQEQVAGVFILLHPKPLNRTIEPFSSLYKPADGDGENYPISVTAPVSNPISALSSSIATGNATEQIITILESITDGFVALDRNWCFTYVNHEGMRTLGRSREELLGKNIWDELPELAGTSFGRLYQEAMATGMPLELEDYYPPFDAYFAVRAYPSPSGLTLYFQNINQRKQADESLRQSEERLRLAMQVAQMGTWDVDLLSGRAIWSERHFTLLGYEPLASGEASETIWLERIHPDDRERVMQEWQRSRQENRLYRAEYRVIHSDGNIFWLSALGNFTYNAQGEAIRSIGVVFDITDRKRAEDDLRQSEERLRLAVNAGRMVAWTWNERTDRLVYSDTACDILGVPPDRLSSTAQDGWNLVHPDDLPIHQARVEAALAQGHSYCSEIRIIRPDNGRVIWVEDRGKVSRDEQGTLISVEGVLFDITARKTVEGALRDSAERLSLALEASRLGDWSWDAATDMVTFSDRAAEIFGIPPGPYMTWTQMRELLYEADRDRARIQVEGAIAHHSDYDIEYRVIRPDGQLRWVAAKGRAQYDDSGRVLGMLGVVQDVSDRKQAETERDQFLARERAAREQAETANRIKDEFLAVLSHELRSPLNPILGWAKLLQTGTLNSQKTQHALETIERNAKLQTQLIEDLLDVSRILRGKLVLSKMPINLVPTLEAALETVRLAAEAKSIQLHLHLADVTPNRQPATQPSPPFQVLGDSARLQQIVWNLLSNAVKFTPPGGRVEVRLTQQDGHAIIQVCDTGKGISPEFLPYVFEYFRQEDGTTTRKFGGLGLGLAIVRHLTELHGGRVAVESPGENQGATLVD